MTAKELAQRLDGREYGEEITRGEAEEAKASGLAVVFGYSDDNIEFRGAIDDEFGAYGEEGRTIYLTQTGPFCKPDDLCDEVPDCPYLKAAMDACKKIHGVYDHGKWKFTTEIPCERFTVYEDGEVFCEGLVFSINDL